MGRCSCAPLTVKMAVHQRDNGHCRYCGVYTVVKGAGSNVPTARTVDHVIPRSEGGRTNIINLVTACKACNERKRSHTLVEAGMKLLPRPSQVSVQPSAAYKKRVSTVCVWCGLGSKRSHLPPTYHGGPKKCRKGDTYYLAQCHLDYLLSHGVL